MDAVVGMEGNGPGNGNPRQMGFLAASKDMVSLDRVAAKIVGVSPDDLLTLKVAKEMGFSTSLDEITVYGDPVDSVKIDDLKPAVFMHVDGPLLIRPLTWLLKQCMTTKPFVSKDACKSCGICIKVCPAGSICQPESNRPVTINHNTCIRCFCCQEVCPEGAITAKDACGLRLLRKMGLIST